MRHGEVQNNKTYLGHIVNTTSKRIWARHEESTDYAFRRNRRATRGRCTAVVPENVGTAREQSVECAFRVPKYLGAPGEFIGKVTIFPCRTSASAWIQSTTRIQTAPATIEQLP